MKRFHVHLHVDDLGIQTDDPTELAALKARAEAADMALLDEGQTSCCYARSEKHWVTDPQGIAWEHFRTLGNIPVFNDAGAQTATAAARSTPTEAPVAAHAAPAARRAPASRGKPIGIAVKSSGACC